MPTVAKNPVPTRLALTSDRLAAPVSNPRRGRRCPTASPLSSEIVGRATFVTPGSGRELSLDRVERAALGARRIAVQARLHPEGHDRLRAQPQVDARDVREALREQSCEHEQQHRQRDLRRRKREAEAAQVLAAERARAARLAARDRDRSPRASRSAAAQKRAWRARRDGEGGRDGARIQADAAAAQARRLQHLDCSQHAEGDGQARDRCEAGEQQCFDGQERDEPAPRGAERRAHGDLADARRAAREHQVREIHAADQQDRGRRGEEDRERRPCAMRALRLWPRAPDTSDRLAR